MADTNSTTQGNTPPAEAGYAERFAGTAAENYERYFVPTIGAAMAAALVAAAQVGPGEKVLDLACGTGTVARLAAERTGATGEVVGLDVNPGMLAVARRVTPPGLTIEWYEARAESMPLPDDRFDVVLCGMGLQFFADRNAALKEVRRVLKPGGRFVASLPGPTPPPFEIMAEELGRHVGPQAAGFVHTVFSLHDPAELEALAEAAGFAGVITRSEFRELRLPPPGVFLWQYVNSTPLASAVAGLDDDSRRTLEHDFSVRCRRLLEQGVTPGATMTTLWATKQPS